MDNTIKRLFIGVKITDELIADIANTKAKLEDKLAGKWVSPENVHLTLKFLGDRSSDEIDNIIQMIRESVIDINAFRLKTTIIGCFPKSSRARVLWLGLEDDERLIGIKNKIEARSLALGLEEDKREYHPHLTFARFKINKRVDIDNINREISIIRELPVERVTLFESKLSRDGAKYNSLENIRLLA